MSEDRACKFSVLLHVILAQFKVQYESGSIILESALRDVLLLLSLIEQ